MKFSIANQHTVYNGFLKIVKADVTFEQFSDGKNIVAPREMMERGDSVGVLLYERDTRMFLLTRQFRFPAAIKDQQAGYNDAGWLDEIPAGKLESDENPEVCAQREVLEELGYECQQLSLIAQFYVSPGGTSERIWLYYAEVESKDKIQEGGGLASEHEHIELVKYDLSRLKHNMKDGRLRDAKSILAVQWWIINHP